MFIMTPGLQQKARALNRGARRLMCCIALVSFACGCKVQEAPPDPATAKAVMDKVTPGEVMRIDRLFDILENAVRARPGLGTQWPRWWVSLRESFSLTAHCARSDTTAFVVTSWSPGADFDVRVVRHRELRRRTDESETRLEQWQTSRVKTLLSSIPTCEAAHVVVGDRTIDIRFDDQWTIRSAELGRLDEPPSPAGVSQSVVPR
jgi:hypothetical protein